MVDLPEPESPTMAVSFWSGTVKVACFSTGSPGTYAKSTWSKVISWVSVWNGSMLPLSSGSSITPRILLLEIIRFL